MKKSLALVLFLSGVAYADDPAQSPTTPKPGTAPTTTANATAPTKSSTADQPGAVVLTLQQAYDTAAKQQPSLRTAKATAEAAAARIDLARVPLNPTATASAAVTAGNDTPHACANGSTTLCGGGFFSGTYGFALGASANWRITDFGLTRANIRAAEANAVAAAAGIDVTTLDVRKQVADAYFESVARARLIKVAESTVKSEEGHLDQAKRFVAAQAKDPIEVAQATSNLANARSALAQAHSNEAVALANLRAAIGWLDASHSPAVEGSWPESPTELPDLQQLVDTARKHRPEIVQYDKQILASDASLTAAHAELRPYIAANAGVQWDPGKDNWSPDPAWSATLSFNLPLWDGGRSRADVRVAEANLSSAIAARDSLLVSLTSALDQARAQIVANRANVQASGEAVDAAKQQLILAEGRYTQGLGSQIELTDAQTAVTTAQGNLVLAEYQLAEAWASLDRAIGQL